MPAFLALIGAAIVLFQLRKRPRTTVAEDLSEEERQKLEGLLKE
jgi:hypothetical protein